MILGLYGDSRSGKDTIARILNEEFDFEWRSFAAPLRQILLNINPNLWDDSGDCHTLQEVVGNFGWDFVKKQHPETVDMMIALGQSVRNLIHVDAWIWSVMTNLPKNMVISDVRQPNEYNTITAAGGEVWKIVRPGTTRRGMDGLLDHHYFPVTFYNNGSPDDLRDTVKREVEHALSNRGDRSRLDKRSSSIHD